MRATDHGSGRGDPAGGFLRVPLLYKLLGANCAFIVLIIAACAGVVLASPAEASSLAVLELLAVVALVAAACAVPLQLAILRLALAPVTILEETAGRVERGDFDARASRSPLADPRMARLTAVFNRLLDAVSRDRQHLREMAAHAFRAQETERVRIAHELEEECAQRLAGVLFRLRATRRTTDPVAREAQFDQLRVELTEILGSLRLFARHLHPPALQELGLVAALQGYARALAESGSGRVSVHGDDLAHILPPDAQLVLYRIVQEAVSNAFHHSGAPSVEVRVAQGDEEVFVEVEDHGCGFEVERTRASRDCLGLLGMQERIGYAEGTIDIRSAPGAGTLVRARVPTREGPPPPRDAWHPLIAPPPDADPALEIACGEAM